MHELIGTNTLRQLLIIMVALVLFNGARAQDSTGHIALKWGPLALIDPCINTVLLGVEIQLSPRWSVQPEAGYMVNISIENESGYRLGMEFRQQRSMAAKRSLRTNPSLPYFGYQLFYSQRVHLQEDAYLYPDSIDYTEPMDYSYPINILYRIWGLGFKLGWQKVYSNNFIIDMYAGAALRVRDIHHLDAPEGIQVEDGYLPLHSSQPGTTIVPGILAGIKLGFRIK